MTNCPSQGQLVGQEGLGDGAVEGDLVALFCIDELVKNATGTPGTIFAANSNLNFL
jgi:hypothetical protein